MNHEFGSLFRQIREKAGFSMGQLARHLGVRVPFLSDVERGVRPPLNLERILSAAELMNLEDPTPLLVAASKSRGAFELSTENVSLHHFRVGAALARGWEDLTEKQLDGIERLVKEGDGEREH